MLMYDTVYSLSLYRYEIVGVSIGGVVLDCTRQVYNLGNGGSQFTMTLWTGLSQTPEIENGDLHFNFCSLLI